MIVYLVPTGAPRYELYCEVASPLQTSGTRRTGLVGRLVDSFTRALAEGEAEREGNADPGAPNRGRLRRFVTRKLAEAVAEQRLLWHLRTETAVVLSHPDDISGDRALELARAEFKSDRDRHRRWAIINGVLMVASTPIALVPGPNLFAYYFIFRLVGHFLSMRGAQQGLDGITWTTQPSADLTALREAFSLASDERDERFEEIAQALGLNRFCAFITGVSTRS
jgi:hypothetical protein